MVSEYNIRLNPNCAAVVNTGLKFKSGDKGIIFRIAVEELDTTGTTAKIVFWRANGTSVESDITGADGIYSYKTLGNEFAVPGKTIADIKVYSEDDRVSTASFLFEVGVDTMDGLGAGAGGYSDRLEQLVSEAEEAGAMTEQAKVDLQSATANLNATEKDMEATVQNFKEAYGEVGALKPRGDWNGSTEYQIRDVVYHNSFSWICLVPNTGKEPSTANAAYWQQMTDLQSIISGTTTVGNSASLGGETSEAWQSKLDNIVNGTTTVGNANNLGGKSASEYFHDLGYLSSSTTILNCIKNAINSGITNGYFLETGSSDSATGSGGLIIFCKADGSSGIYIEEWDRQNGIIYRSKGISVNSISIEWTSPCATTADLANYLPLSGGTIKGDIAQSFDDNSNVFRTIKNSVRTIKEDVHYTGEYKLEDITNGKNIIHSTTDGTNTFYGKATGQGNPVAIQSTAPSDTSALWVDTANKVIKAYIDGAWTQVS